MSSTGYLSCHQADGEAVLQILEDCLPVISTKESCTTNVHRNYSSVSSDVFVLGDIEGENEVGFEPRRFSSSNSHGCHVNYLGEAFYFPRLEWVHSGFNYFSFGSDLLHDKSFTRVRI